MTPATPDPLRDADARYPRRTTALAHLLDGTLARSADGETIGHVSNAILDLRGGRIVYVLVALVPIEESVHARRLAMVPWEYVTLDADAGGLQIATSAAIVRGAPALDLDGWLGSTDTVWEDRMAAYYQGVGTPRAHSFAEELGLRSPVPQAHGRY
ncbi:PRC-barrel domain-containing protein [Burkholderia gladioli]|uniref:PRC-barrel domain-containing protein n=1 Tax=Burkholderia gladioli TaxID=28095 RepID=UPI00163EC57C|nr:PRC-barrel domain-containing protein [Burkholderia gladioli]